MVYNIGNKIKKNKFMRTDDDMMDEIDEETSCCSIKYHVGKLKKIIYDKNVEKEYKKICSEYTYMPAYINPVRRIIAMGDIHGDFKLVKKLFRIAKLVDNEDNWIAKPKDTYVVQVGDQVDRCRPTPNGACDKQGITIEDEASDIKILEYFNTIHKKARVHGGAVISLLGNHEIMNVLGDLNYVSHEGLKFNNYKIDSEKINYNQKNIKESGLENEIENGKYARRLLFSPGNKYANLLGCTRLSSVIIGTHLFIHAGLIDPFLRKLNIKETSDMETINRAISRWLLGLLDRKYIEKLISNIDSNSMFWTRKLGFLPPNLPERHYDCIHSLSEVLKVLHLKGMVIGHTPTSFKFSSGINRTCGNIWRVDNGSSKAFHNFDPSYDPKTGEVDEARVPQVLEILDDLDKEISDPTKYTYNILK